MEHEDGQIPAFGNLVVTLLEDAWLSLVCIEYQLFLATGVRIIHPSLVVDSI